MTDHACQPLAGPLDATVTLPGSKSITNRALVAAALADGQSVLSGALLAEDTWLMIEALRSLGVPVTVDEAGRAIEVSGCRGHIPESEARLFCGNSGTTIRFCTAVAALGQGRYELDGISRMRQRPIGGLVAAIRSLGGGIECLGREGFPPIVVHACGLRGGEVLFESPESSQLVSALLLASPGARGDVLIEVRGDVPSVPYLRMTSEVMAAFGVTVLAQDSSEENGAARFIIETPQRYQGRNFRIEPDASNATYFWAAAAVAGGRVRVEGLGSDSIQGDVRFVDVLERMGCRAEREAGSITVHGPAPGERLRGIDVDLNEMPDTAQTLAVTALFADGPTTIRNVGTLRVKETDRIAALATELRKFGAEVEELPDALVVAPPADLAGLGAGERIGVETYNDHRMAMSLAVAGLRVSGVVIRGKECVGKTFPEFFEMFQAIGGKGTKGRRDAGT